MKYYLPVLFLFMSFGKSTLAQHFSYPTDVLANKIAFATTAFSECFTASGNPAILAKTNSFNLRASVRNRFQTTTLNDYGFISSFKLGHLGIGLNIEHFSFELFRQQQLVLSTGMPLSSKLSVGINFGILTIKQELQESISSLYGSLGLLYTINNQLNIGLHLMPFNPSSPKKAHSQYSVRNYKVGLSYQPNKLVLVNFDLQYFQDMDANFSGKLGLIYKIIPKIELGLGYHSNPNSFSFGLTWQINEVLQVHLASGSHQTLGLSPIGGFSYKSINNN